MALFDALTSSEEEKKKKEEEATLQQTVAQRLQPKAAVPPAETTAPVDKDVPLMEKVASFTPKTEEKPLPPVTPVVNKKEEATNKKAEIAKKIQAADEDIKDAPLEDLVAGINDDIPRDSSPEMKWLNKQWQGLQQKTDEQKRSVEWRQAAETVAQALTRVFAAKAGLKSGVDMSGLKFERTDFDKKLQMLDDQLEKRKAQVEKIAVSAEQARKEREAAAAKAEADAKKAAEDKALAAKRDADMAAAAAEDKRRWEAGQSMEQQKFAFQKEQVGLDKAAQEEAAKAKEAKLLVPGFAGKAATEAEAKELRNAVAEVAQSSTLLDEIIDLGKDVKITDREKVNLIEQKIGQLAGTLRTSLMGPGAMSDTERKALTGMIGNPAKLFGTESTEIAKLKALKTELRRGLEGKAASMMDDGTPVADARQPQAPAPATTETPRQKLERLRALKAGK